MTHTRLVTHIARGALFASLNADMLDDLARIARIRRIAAREIIFEEGDPCAGFYLLTDGAVKLYKLSGDGKEHILHLVWPDETFAEAALFLDEAYPATAEALKPSKALLFPREPFLTLLDARPAMARRLIGGMAGWVRRLVGQIEVLALRDAGAKVASYLRQLERDGRSVFRAPKATVAAHLGITPETLSRLLSKLEARDLVVVHGRTVEIRDGVALDAIGAGSEQI